MMKKLPYTRSDIERWCTVNQREVDEIREEMQLLPADDKRGRADLIRALSLAHEGLAFSRFADEDYQNAVGHFRMACGALSEIYSVSDDQKIGWAPGDFQALLIAWAAKSDSARIQLATALASASVDPIKEWGPPDSAYLSSTIAYITVGKMGTAARCLERPPRSIDPRFRGYGSVLSAVVELDQRKTVDALHSAAESWSRYVARNERNLPYSACFVHGVGLARMGQAVIGSTLELDTEAIPLNRFEVDDARNVESRISKSRFLSKA